MNLQTEVLGKVEAIGGAASLKTKSIGGDECIWGKHISEQKKKKLWSICCLRCVKNTYYFVIVKKIYK